ITTPAHPIPTRFPYTTLFRSVKNREYVEAAKVIGARDRRVIFRHILPNVTPIVIVWASLVIPALILVEASLSFLGLGVQPPTPRSEEHTSELQSREISYAVFC